MPEMRSQFLEFENSINLEKGATYIEKDEEF